MKHVKFLAMVLALLMLLVVIAGCAGKPNGEKQNETANNSFGSLSENTQNNSDKESTDEEGNTDVGSEGIVIGGEKSGFKIEKIGSLFPDKALNIHKFGGFYYQNSEEMYGIISPDGTLDSGAKYTSCTPWENWYQISTVTERSYDDLESLNCFGLADLSGQEILPMHYSTFEKLSDRYVLVIRVTEPTESKEEALVYFSSSSFHFISPGEGDKLFKGVWSVFDMETGKILEKATGTKSPKITAYGNFVQYRTDAGETVAINDKGTFLPEEAFLCRNGCYVMKTGNMETVYDSDGNKIFHYISEKPFHISSIGKYFCLLKEDNGEKYVLYDLSGKIASAEFSFSPSIYGDLIYRDQTGEVYDFDGNSIINGTFERIYLDETFGRAWYLRNDNAYTLIQKDGTVLFQENKSNEVSVDIYENYNIKKTTNGKDLYYSFADKDFTLEGKEVAPWMIQVEKSDSNSVLVDTISGEILLGGYLYYNSSINGSTVYIYAQAADGTIDIYTIR